MYYIICNAFDFDVMLIINMHSVQLLKVITTFNIKNKSQVPIKFI